VFSDPGVARVAGCSRQKRTRQGGVAVAEGLDAGRNGRGRTHGARPLQPSVRHSKRRRRGREQQHVPFEPGPVQGPVGVQTSETGDDLFRYIRRGRHDPVQTVFQFDHGLG